MVDGRAVEIMREVRRTKAEIAAKYPLFVVVRHCDDGTLGVIAKSRIAERT